MIDAVRAPLRVPLLGLLVLAGCAGALPREFAAVAATAPEDMPAQLWLDGDSVVQCAAAVGPVGLPEPVRAAIDAVVPGGQMLFLGRQWGGAGEGFRVEKRYVDGATESFRTALLAPDGTVLERAHTVPIAKVPAAVLSAAMAFGRDVHRCDIVSDTTAETGWRLHTRDGGGRTFVVAIDLDGNLRSAQRIVAARVGVPRQ